MRVLVKILPSVNLTRLSYNKSIRCYTSLIQIIPDRYQDQRRSYGTNETSKGLLKEICNASLNIKRENYFNSPIAFLGLSATGHNSSNVLLIPLEWHDGTDKYLRSAIRSLFLNSSNLQEKHNELSSGDPETETDRGQQTKSVVEHQAANINYLKELAYALNKNFMQTFDIKGLRLWPVELGNTRDFKLTVNVSRDYLSLSPFMKIDVSKLKLNETERSKVKSSSENKGSLKEIFWCKSMKFCDMSSFSANTFPLTLTKKSFSTSAITWRQKDFSEIKSRSKCDPNYNYPYLSKIFGTENLLMSCDAYSQAVLEAAKRRAALEECQAFCKKTKNFDSARPQVKTIKDCVPPTPASPKLCPPPSKPTKVVEGDSYKDEKFAKDMRAKKKSPVGCDIKNENPCKKFNQTEVACKKKEPCGRQTQDICKKGGSSMGKNLCDSKPKKHDPCKMTGNDDPCKQRTPSCSKPKESPCKKEKPKENPCKQRTPSCGSKPKENQSQKEKLKEDPCKQRTPSCGREPKESQCQKEKPKEDPCKQRTSSCGSKPKESQCQKEKPKENPCKQRTPSCGSKPKENQSQKEKPKEDPCKQRTPSCGREPKESQCQKEKPKENPCKQRTPSCGSKPKESQCQKEKPKEDPCKQWTPSCGSKPKENQSQKEKPKEDPCKQRTPSCGREPKESQCQKEKPKENPCKQRTPSCGSKPKESECQKEKQKDGPCKKTESSCGIKKQDSSSQVEKQKDSSMIKNPCDASKPKESPCQMEKQKDSSTKSPSGISKPSESPKKDTQKDPNMSKSPCGGCPQNKTDASESKTKDSSPTKEEESPCKKRKGPCVSAKKPPPRPKISTCDKPTKETKPNCGQNKNMFSTFAPAFDQSSSGLIKRTLTTLPSLRNKNFYNFTYKCYFSSKSKDDKDKKLDEFARRSQCKSSGIRVPPKRKPAFNPHPKDGLRKCYPTYDMDCKKFCKPARKTACQKYEFLKSTDANSRKSKK